MPVGLFTTWNSGGDELVPSKSWRAADEWLAWVSRDLANFRTRLDDGEKRIGPRQLPVGDTTLTPKSSTSLTVVTGTDVG